MSTTQLESAETSSLPANPTEASWLPRVVAVLTPFFAVLAAAITNWVTRTTGANLDPAEITALMVIAATAALSAALKWLHGWQQHERLVAEGLDTPVKPGPVVRAQLSSDGGRR